MQAQAHPPRIASVLRGAAIGVLCGLSIPVLYLFPAFVYDLLFRADHLLPYIVHAYGNFLSSLPVLGTVTIIGLLGAFYVYSRERRKWKGFQKLLAQSAADVPPPAEQRVEMPEPATIPATRIVLGGYRSLWGFIAPIAVVIWGGGAAISAWSEFLFIWPPNDVLQRTIFGTSAVVAILGAIVVWRKLTPRPTVFDDLGITIFSRKSSRQILWSEVRHLVLLPVDTPEGKHVAHAAELYCIVTNDRTAEVCGCSR